jgi:hypothetical protein
MNYKIVVFLSQTESTPKHFFRKKSLVLWLSSSVIEWRFAIFSIVYSFGISGTGLIFLKTLEAVISSVEVSEGSVVLKM